MPLPDCDVCQFREDALKCIYYDCLKAGDVPKSQEVMDQLIELYRPVLEVDAQSFALAVYHANEPPDLTPGQRIKLFHYHYKPLKINRLDRGTPVKEKAKIEGGIELW